MKRKIVQQGKSSLNISIPSSWTKKNGIKKGDEIDVEEKDGNLILSSHKNNPIMAKVLDIRDLENSSIKWYLISLYCSGYDEVKVVFKDHDQIDSINSITRNLLGYNIMEQKSKYCIIRSISQPIEEEFEPSLRRIFMVVLSIADSTFEAIKSKDKKAFNSVLTMEDTCNRISCFCLRLLNKKGYKNTSKTTYMHSLIRRLENIADSYGSIMIEIKRKNLEINISNDILDLFLDINSLLRIFYESFYKTESNKIDLVAKKVNTEFDRIMSYKTTANETEQHVLYFLNLIRNSIGESLVPMLAINTK